MQTITSRQNPLVHRYREAARGKDTGTDLTILDGAHLLEEALAAGLHLAHAAFSADALEVPAHQSLVGRLEQRGVPVQAVTGHVMAALSPVTAPSGVVALARRPRWSLDEVFARQPPLVVAGVAIQEPGNVGALLRAAEAGGATGAVLITGSADPFGWKALRGSMGSAFRLPSLETDAATFLGAARGRGVAVVAAVPRGGRPLFQWDFRGPAAFLLGSEGPGLPPDLIERADGLLTIPMVGPIESLNVAVAAALLVYEAYRQRTPVGTES